MGRRQRDRERAAAANRADWRPQTFARTPAFPGTGIVGAGGMISPTGNVPRVATGVEVDIARNPREAMTSRIATAPGPIPTRLRTAGSKLDPAKIDRVFQCADLGLAIYEYADLCKAMRERDTHILGVDRHRRQAVANKPYVVTPSDDADPVAVALSFLTRAAIREIADFQASIYSALSKNCDGWSLSEILWRHGTVRFRVPSGNGSGSLIEVPGLWPNSIEWVHPKHTEFDTRGAGADEPMLNVGAAGAIHLPPHKFLYMRAPGEGIASARGYSRSVVWMHFFKHASWRDWVVFLHLYGIPFMQGKADRGIYKDAAMMDILERALETYGSGEERPILPEGLGIEVHDPVSIGGSGEAHKAMIGMCNSEISKAIEGATLNSEAGGPGSYALGYVHADSAHEVTVGDAVGTSAEITAQLHRSLIEVNADNIARAFALAGLSVKPWDLLSRTPIGMFRTDREWTPEVRQRLFSGALKDGVPVSRVQYRHELQLDAPHDEADTLKGPAMAVADGGAVVGAVDASQGVRIEKSDDTKNAATDATGARTDTTGEPVASPDAPRINLTSTDIATIITVDEARASQGLPSLGGEDGKLTVAEFKAKHAAVVADAAAASDGKTEPKPSDDGEED